MKKIYYDITNLIEWKGNLTGIPRVTDELALRLKGRKDVDFIRWDFVNKRFTMVDIADYYENIAPQNRSYFKRGNGRQTPIIEPGFIGLTKKIIRRSPLLSRVAGDAKRKLVVARDKYADSKIKTIPNNRLELDNEGVIFIPCGLWDNEPYIQSLISYKKSGLRLCFLSYDILPIVVPQFSGQWGLPMIDFTNRVTSICDRIFSISEHTTSDLKDYLKGAGKKVPKIKTIRLGDMFSDTSPVPPSDPIFKRSKVLETGEDFILCTGTLEARKNHTLLYYTYKLALSKGIELPKIIVAGRPGHRTQDIISIIEDDPDTKNNILLLKDVSDGELSWLYANCRFSIYPSFYEGWGLPIAESISKGVPCLASNTSSMPEVAPGFADYFNPASADDCLSMIQTYLDDKHISKVRKKIAGYKPVSWDLTYTQVIEELETISLEG